MWLPCLYEHVKYIKLATGPGLDEEEKDAQWARDLAFELFATPTAAVPCALSFVPLQAVSRQIQPATLFFSTAIKVLHT